MTFETELSSRRKTLLYLYQVCPLIDIIDKVYNMKKDIEHKDCIQWYIGIYPFRNNTNKTYMRWFVREFNIFSKLSRKEINYLKQSHRTIFMNLSSMYDKSKNREGLGLCDTNTTDMKYTGSYNCI